MGPDGPAHEPREMWDWEILQDDWWKTTFRAISWAYKTKPDHPRPPHYHDLLARGRRRRIAGDAHRAAGGAAADVSLNSALCGVRAAEEALRRYELEVAILPSDDLSQPPPHDQSPCPESLYAEGAWDEKVRELLGGILEHGALPEVDSLAQDVPLWDLNNLESPTLAPSSPGTADLTDSETSVESDPPPSTPKPAKASYARIVSSEASTESPTVLSPLPSKLLSAAALTFIPSTPNRASSREPTTPPLTSSSNSSDSPFSSPTYNFHFPSLNSTSPADRRESRSLPPSLQKDESGFYIEVADDPEIAPGSVVTGTQSLGNTRSTTPRRPSAAFLPAFLTDGSPTARSRNSKTREIVDRLRSSGSAGSGRKAKKSNSNRRQASASASAPSASTKDADLAGFVPDAASANGANAKEDGITDGWISGVTQTQAQQPTPAASSASQQQHQQQQQPKSNRHGHGHGHKRSSGSSTSHPPSSTFSPASSTMSLTVPHTPASGPAQLPPMPPLYPGAPTGVVPYPQVGAYPGPYATANPAAYMHAAQMQYHHQAAAARGPWPMGLGSMGYQPGMYPMYQPFGVMPAAMPYGMVQVPVGPPGSMFYDGKGKSAGGALVQ